MKKYQLAGIGNAIVDVIARAPDHLLDDLGIRKGVMQLVGREQAEALLSRMDERSQSAGGSVANTIVGAGTLGLRTAFLGRVHDDELGRFCAADTARTGTDFVNPPVPDGELPTSRCMIFVTPDGERSMSTYLGISAELGPEDVNEAVMADSEYVFLEGYLFDKDKGKEAFLKAARTCRKAGGRVGVALSDPFCVTRHRDDFRRLIRDEMDFVIGNQQEWVALYHANDITDALAQAAHEAPMLVCTRSGDTVMLMHDGHHVELPVERTVPVDATGAGDQFAAGFLYGLATGHSLETSGRMGCIAASEVISHMGARPQANVRAQLHAAGLL